MAHTSQKLSILALAALTSCALPGVGGYVGYMKLNIGGNFALEDLGSQPLSDLTQQVDDDLNLKEADTPYARVFVSSGGWRVNVSGFQFEESGVGTLSQNFGGISAGANVQSDVDLLNVKGSVTYDLLDFSVFRLSPGVSLDYFDVQMRVDDGIGNFEEVDYQAPVPMAFVQVEADAGPFSIVAEVGGLSIDLPDAKGQFWDAEAMLRFNPAPMVELFAGYRFIRLDSLGNADGLDFDTDLQLHGWFAGGGVNF